MYWLSRFFPDALVPNLVTKKLLDCYPIAQNAQSMVLQLDDILSSSGEYYVCKNSVESTG